MEREVRLRAILNDRHAAPDPAKQRIGRGSTVTVVAIEPGRIGATAYEPWPGLAIDEYGRLVTLDLNWLTFAATQPERRDGA